MATFPCASQQIFAAYSLASLCNFPDYLHLNCILYKQHRAELCFRPLQPSLTFSWSTWTTYR